VALELALRWPFSFGGDDDKPSTAESTLVSAAVSADMMISDDWMLSEDSESSQIRYELYEAIDMQVVESCGRELVVSLSLVLD
jgi:hypothetical protein